jgi:hypothetical protein
MDLTDTELCEEIPKVLSTENRHLPQNLVIYSFKDGGYVPFPKTTNVVTIFEYEGTAIHIDSAEAKAQIARDGEPGIDPRIADLRSGSQTGTTTPDLDRTEGDENPEGEEGEGEDAEGEKIIEFILYQKNFLYKKVQKQERKRKKRAKKNRKIWQLVPQGDLKRNLQINSTFASELL